MRIALVAALWVMLIKAYGQYDVQLAFYDACSSEVISLPYLIEDFELDSLHSIKEGGSTTLNSGFYQVQTSLVQGELISHFNFDLHVNETDVRDTLYLSKIRNLGPTHLHPTAPEEFNYYSCETKCNGYVEEVDDNGVIRFKGTFHNGTPTSNLTYFDSSGNRSKKLIYRNGVLKRIK